MVLCEKIEATSDPVLAANEKCVYAEGKQH